MLALCKSVFVVALVSFALAEAHDEEALRLGRERYQWIMDQYQTRQVGAPAGRVLPEQQEREWQATMRLQREWEATRHALVTTLGRTDSDGTKHRLIAALMQMRCPDAVQALIREIKLKQGVASEGHGALSQYPAALALAKIGQPAVRTILDGRLKLPATEQELGLFAAVVHAHYGLETPVGRFHVQHVLEQAQRQLEAEKQPPGLLVTWEKNLTRVLELYDAIERGKLEPGASAP